MSWMMMMMMPRLGHPGFFLQKNPPTLASVLQQHQLSLIWEERWPSRESLAGTVSNCLNAFAVPL
jgi:hypothetical protein